MKPTHKSPDRRNLRLIASAALAGALAAAPIANADCLQFDFTRPWFAVQSNGYRVTFNLHQQQPTVAGFAEACDAGGNCSGPRKVTGSVRGATISLSTGWGGEYTGRVNSNGRLIGNTYGRDLRAGRDVNEASWFAYRNINCVVNRATPAASNDFNADGKGDIVWHNGTTGEIQVWLMRANARVGRATVHRAGQPQRIGPPWWIAGSRDFNGDGIADLLWYNHSTGETQLWFMKPGAELDDRATVEEANRPLLVGPPWQLIGAHDMNGDGRPDVVWYNRSTGTVQVWLMDRHKITRKEPMLEKDGSVLVLAAEPVAIRDMDWDGLPDLIVRAGDRVQVLFLKGLQVDRHRPVRALDGNVFQLGRQWTINGANDFNRDGYGDLVLHNAASGQTMQWWMRGEVVEKQVPVRADLDGGGDLIGAPWRQVQQ